MVMAVPRQGFKAREHFVVQGADVYFEGCIVGVGPNCETGLFVSDCRADNQLALSHSSNDEISGVDCRRSRYGSKIIYIYDRQRGVLAFEQADWWSEGGEDVSKWSLERLGVDVSMLALQGSRGLLSCPMPVAK